MMDWKYEGVRLARARRQHAADARQRAAVLTLNLDLPSVEPPREVRWVGEAPPQR